MLQEYASQGFVCVLLIGHIMYISERGTEKSWTVISAPECIILHQYPNKFSVEGTAPQTYPHWGVDTPVHLRSYGASTCLRRLGRTPSSLRKIPNYGPEPNVVLKDCDFSVLLTNTLETFLRHHVDIFLCEAVSTQPWRILIIIIIIIPGNVYGAVIML